MKAYTYQSSQIGLTEWPSGTLRLDGVVPVTDPGQADIFICPGNLSLFQDNGIINKDRLYRLPHLAGNEHRSVFFDVSDNFKTPIGLPLVFIRCDARTWMLKDDPNTLSVAWPVEDYAECVELPTGGFKFDVSFQGWLSSDARIESSRSCRESDLKSDITEYADFCGYIYYSPEGIRRRGQFRRSMRESRLALCPESIPGVLPYRFFEAMSAGRVPVLVSSDYVLPFADKIPYDSFILRIERNQAGQTAATIKAFLAKHPDDELIRMGLAAREFWVRWLDSSLWPKTMAYAVKQKLFPS